MTPPLRVLQIVSIMNAGGLETMLMNLYRHIDREKLQFDFMVQVPKAGLYDEEIRRLGGQIWYVPGIRYAGPFKYTRNLRAFFTAHQEYRVVHSHMIEMSGVILQQAKRAGVPATIAHSHTMNPQYHLLETWYKKYSHRLIDRYADYAFACSMPAGEYLFGNSRRFRNLFRILPNAVDSNRFLLPATVVEEVKRELDLPDGLILGHIGRFTTPKNHGFLIDVFSAVAQRRADALLLLIGDGPLRQEIEEKAHACGVADNIHFLGIRADVHRIIQTFDLMVFPSLREGLPVTLIEAQAAGVPCFVADAITRESDMGMGLLEFVPGYTVEMWAERILARSTWKREAADKAQRLQKLQEQGYDAAASAQQLTDFYYRAAGIPCQPGQDLVSSAHLMSENPSGGQ